MALTRYTLRQFEAFTAVADSLGFATAGKRLGLSASAVSQLIAELESLLGFRLFERTTRRVELSSAGRNYLPAVLAVLRQVRQAELDAEAINMHATAIVKLAAPQMMASAVLPAALRAYMQENPDVVIRMVDSTVDALVERVVNGEADVSVGPTDARRDRGVRSEVLYHSKWALWCSPDSPVADQTHVTWTQLRDLPLVASWSDRSFELARRHYGAHDPRALTRLEVVDNLSTAFGLARIGRSAVVGPSYVWGIATCMGLVHKPIVDPELAMPIYLFQPEEHVATPFGTAFGDFLSSWMRQNAHAFDGQSAASTK